MGTAPNFGPRRSRLAELGHRATRALRFITRSGAWGDGPSSSQLLFKPPALLKPCLVLLIGVLRHQPSSYSVDEVAMAIVKQGVFSWEDVLAQRYQSK